MWQCIAHLFYFPFKQSQYYSSFFLSIYFTYRYSLFLFSPSRCLLHFLKIQKPVLARLLQLHSEFLNSFFTSTVPRLCVLNNIWFTLLTLSWFFTRFNVRWILSCSSGGPWCTFTPPNANNTINTIPQNQLTLSTSSLSDIRFHIYLPTPVPILTR
jgi:hypothetical protein